MAGAPDDRIVLDSSSFKALASESRVLILKELAKKRCTASEISKTLGISVQAASEHLENLRIAGLVERVDEGRKWIYFTLTEKGKAVVVPGSGKKLWIMLTVFALVIATAGFMLFTNPSFNFLGSAKAPEGVFNTPAGLLGSTPFLQDAEVAKNANTGVSDSGGAAITASRNASDATNSTNSSASPSPGFGNQSNQKP